MKIAQIAPLAESVPPQLYGGTERIVSYLTEELVRQGHDVTLFASADSRTSARLIPCADRALRLNPDVRDMTPHHVVMLDDVRRRASEFDVLHFHIDVLHFPLFSDMAERTVTTTHGRLDLYDLQPCLAAFPAVPLVSISRSQRRPVGRRVLWVGNVYHGLPSNLLHVTANPPGDYFAFLGRISPEKRPDRAIEIAAHTGMPLKIAAKVDRADEAYWREVIGPMVAAHPNVEFIGEISDEQKPAFLGNARALLFPIDWPEPFGLVMIEAMACGTPVLAYRCGAVPEVIDEGITGYIVDDMDSAVAAALQIDRLDRHAVRQRFAERFSVERMARDYLDVYRRLPGIGEQDLQRDERRATPPGRQQAA